MGIYDRDYYRQGRSGFRLRAPRSAVGAIILLNVAVFVLEIIEPGLVDLLSVHVPMPVQRLQDKTPRRLERAAIPQDDQQDLDRPQHDTLRQPWMWWQFLTYGFVHDPTQTQHIFFNMLTLFFLGRDVEQWYGTREFIRLYMLMLVFASVIWAVAERLLSPHQLVGPDSPLNFIDLKMFGASGAIAGVVVLYALNFPKRILLFMFVLPLPAWLLGVMVIGFDVWGAVHRGDNVAYTAHLAGAAFALMYFNLHWNLGRFFESAATWLKGRSRPSLKVFKPEDGPPAPVADEDVDRILEKIHREGENSLTRKERRILESASREYQRRRHPE